MASAPLRRRFLSDLLALRRTGHHPDGRPVGPVLGPRLDAIIDSIAASLTLTVLDGGLLR